MKRLVSLILTVIMMLSGLTAFAETENAPKELHYTPGEDLVIAEKDGIRIILKGRQNDDFGEFIEPWDAYNWYTLLVDNDTEFDVALKYSSVVDGIGTTGKNSTNFGGYRKHSSEEWEITLRTEVYKNSDGTIDEEALHSAINAPKTWMLDIEVMKADYDAAKTEGVLTVLDPVLIYFDGEAGSANAATETPEDKSARTDKVYTDKETVKAVQQALNEAGYNCGTPDGIAGKKTFAAIIQYRTDKGLEVNENIDDALLEALGLASAQPVDSVEDAQPQHDETDRIAPNVMQPDAEGTPVNITNTLPEEFIILFNSTLDMVYGQYFGGSSEASSVIENMKLNSASAEILETDIEGMCQINISGMLNGIAFVCSKEDGYPIIRLVYGFSTQEGEDMMRILLPSAYAFTMTVSAYLNGVMQEKEEDELQELISTEGMELLNKFGFQGTWGALSVENWTSDYTTDIYSIHLEKDEDKQTLSFVADLK